MNEKAKELINLAESLNIKIEVKEHRKLLSLINDSKVRSLVLKCSKINFKNEQDLDEELLETKGNIISVMEGVSDPQNLGTLIRNVHFMGTKYLVGINKIIDVFANNYCFILFFFLKLYFYNFS